VDHITGRTIMGHRTC